MARLRIFLLILVLLTSLAGCNQVKTNNNQVLLVLAEQSTEAQNTDYMLKFEVNTMVDMLKKAGFDPVLASPTGLPIGSFHKITPDMKLADVKVEEYAGVIFPCMEADFVSPYYPEPLQIAQKAAALKKPIAAQDHGIFTLSAAGVMDGKQYALSIEFHDQGLVPYGIYKGKDVVQDGNIFTSGFCPWADNANNLGRTKELTQKFIDYMKTNQ